MERTTIKLPKELMIELITQMKGDFPDMRMSQASMVEFALTKYLKFAKYHAPKVKEHYMLGIDYCSPEIAPRATRILTTKPSETSIIVEQHFGTDKKGDEVQYIPPLVSTVGMIKKRGHYLAPSLGSKKSDKDSNVD